MVSDLTKHTTVAKRYTLAALMAAGTPIPAISYARVSSEKQLHGEGLKRQGKGTHAWIAKHPEYGIRLDIEATDRARSAWKGDHIARKDAALGKLLAMVESGELRPPLMLIVEALDRFSRENKWQANSRLSGLVSKGVIVATTQDDKLYDLDSGIGDIIMSVVILAKANQESEDKSFRVSETKAIRAQEAMTTKNVLHQNVMGWLSVPDAVSPSNRATRRYEVKAECAKTVLLMYQMALDHGAAYITSWLIANREAFGRSGQWNIRYVKNILASRAPLGHLQTKQGLIEDTLPRIIDDDLWLRVQAARKKREGQGGQKLGGTANLLAGIGRCGTCTGRLRINRHGRTGHTYYECERHAVFKTCDNRNRYRMDLIEAALLHRFGMGWLECEPIAGMTPTDLPSLEAELAKLQAREKRLGKRLQELDNDDMFDTIVAQLRELRNKVHDAATRLNVARQTVAVAAAPVRIRDMTDRSALHTVLRQRISSACFGNDHTVELRAGSQILTVVARKNGPPPALAIEATVHKPATLIRLNARVDIKWKATRTAA